MSRPTVRPASSQDVSTILSFIRAGAEDQAPGTQPGATEERLSKTLHLIDVTEPSEHRIGRPLLIFSPEGEPAGLLIYFYNYSTWAAAPGVCLEELYVAPQYRSLGYANLLIDAMASHARDAGCVKMEWLCLKDNVRALRFYEKLGAELKEDWAILKVDQAGIERLCTDKSN
ncbi:acetyltransferase [Fusarium heterosporum]|uniref:Acetyltransferase n=1 Tax=Fusarium heterosporum TaxID=42747 RepID=A0A8H5TCC1_FUSHE|nr:acetyltransferase [Fusarium heterosporum]